MSLKAKGFTREKALLIVAAAAALLLFAIALRYMSSRGGPDIGTRAGRQSYLAGLGWEIDPDSEEAREVLIPDCSEGLMADYNRLQQEQGFDLSPYSGRSCRQYSYRVTNYPGYEQGVLVTLYTDGRSVIGGDIHSAALNGFMHGLLRSP